MSIAVFGEALIDFIEGADGAYRPHLGGSPYNVAIGLARQGVETSYLSSMSDDGFGDQLYQSLVNEGVRLPFRRRSLWPTSLALVNLDSEGQATYRLYREGIADKDTGFEEIADCIPDDLRVFHTGSLAITPSQLPKIRQVFALVKERGVLISIDINIRIRASIDQNKYLQGVRSLLSQADIVKASDEDLLALGISKDIRETAEIVHGKMKGGILVLTEGDGGAIVYSPKGQIARDSYRIDEVVDTVGAGDTFHSAFLAHLFCGRKLTDPVDEISAEDLGHALNFACAAAAINVSRAGCSPPTREEVEKFVETAEGASAGA